jgi:hypothetical protein
VENEHAVDGCSRQKENFCMFNITVGRLPQDPEAQGVIRPADNSWQLVIDKDGFPHLWLRVKGQDGETGMVPLDMFLQEDCSVKDIMMSEFGGEITDESEIGEALLDWESAKERLGIPCPKA